MHKLYDAISGALLMLLMVGVAILLAHGMYQFSVYSAIAFMEGNTFPGVWYAVMVLAQFGLAWQWITWACPRLINAELALQEKLFGSVVIQ